MNDPRWERLAAWTGAAGAVLFVVQAVMVKVPPMIEDSIPVVGRYYVDHRAGIQAQMFLTGIAGVLFLWFVGTLRSYLRQAEGGTGRLSGIAFGSAIAASGPVTAGALAASVLALEVGRIAGPAPAVAPLRPLGPGAIAAGAAIRILHDTRLMSYSISWFALAPFVAAVAVVSIRTEAFPLWHAWFGSALFVLAIASGAGVFAGSGAFAPGGAVSYATFLLFLVWTFVTSALMAREIGTSA